MRTATKRTATKTTAKKTVAKKVPAKTAEVSDEKTTDADTAVVDVPKERDPNIIRKKELVDHVVVETGLRKREVREAFDSVFSYIHACLSEGKQVECPPLGKIRVNWQKSGTPDAKMNYRVVLRRPGAGVKNNSEDVKEALAETPE